MPKFFPFKKGKNHIRKECKKHPKGAKANVFFRRMKYCPGSGHELLSASTVLAVCHDSSVFLVRSFPLSMIAALSN